MTGRMIPSDFVKNVAQNGVGRYICQLQRITFKFCKEHGGSRAMREYIEKNILDFTRNNPGIVVYLKPRRHRPPTIVAEYLNRQEQSMSCSKMTSDEIARWVDHFRSRSGVDIVRLRKMWHTDTPSIQGVWHPLLNQDPRINLTRFPDSELSHCTIRTQSATDVVLEMREKHAADDKLRDKSSVDGELAPGTSTTDKSSDAAESKVVSV